MFLWMFASGGRLSCDVYNLDAKPKTIWNELTQRGHPNRGKAAGVNVGYPLEGAVSGVIHGFAALSSVSLFNLVLRGLGRFLVRPLLLREGGSSKGSNPGSQPIHLQTASNVKERVNQNRMIF